MNMDNHKVIVTFKEPWDRTSAPVKRKDWQHTDITMVFDHVNLVDIDVTGWLVVRRRNTPRTDPWRGGL
jgi:hypothetical protein